MFECENAKLMSNRMIAGTASEQALCDRIIGRILNESVITNLKMVDVNSLAHLNLSMMNMKVCLIGLE